MQGDLIFGLIFLWEIHNRKGFIFKSGTSLCGWPFELPEPYPFNLTAAPLVSCPDRAAGWGWEQETEGDTFSATGAGSCEINALFQAISEPSGGMG